MLFVEIESTLHLFNLKKSGLVILIAGYSDLICMYVIRSTGGVQT